MSDFEIKLWLIVNAARDRGEYPSLSSILAGCKDAGLSIGIPELSVIVSKFMGREWPVPYVPQEITQFIAKILQPHAPKRILDPCAGVGFLAIPLSEMLGTEHFDAYCFERDSEVWEFIQGSESVSLHHGAPLKELQRCTREFDAVVSFPPIGMRQYQLSISLDGKAQQIRDEYGHLLILEACQHLAPNGVAIVIGGSSFFGSSGRLGKARDALSRMGIRPTAAIELPAGTFSPTTAISTHIIVLERTDSNFLFTGRVSSSVKQQQNLLDNLCTRTPGKAPELGRLVPIEQFRGFTAIELDEKVKETAKRMGLVGYAFDAVVKELNSPSGSGGNAKYEIKENAVYLPQMATTAAQTDEARLPEKLKSYFQLVIDPDVADAKFVAGLLNSPFGQLWRDSIRTGSIIPRIGQSTLKAATIYLPPKGSHEIQQRVLECQQRITRLGSEIRELESQLWRRIQAVEKIEKAIDAVNREDHFEDWLDTLPFPLASILWACHTQAGSPKEQYERKLHFFEAFSQFLGIVYLSAVSADADLWDELLKKLTTTLTKANLSLERATFGTWKTVVEVLGARCRQLFQDEEERALGLFRTRDRELLNGMLSKRIVALLQETNQIRNTWQGHVGAVSARDARKVNDRLQVHIDSLREIIGIAWEDYELVIPGTCTHESGEFLYSVKKVMGTRTPFPTSQVAVLEPMENGHLYLKHQNESRGLKLLPLVKVMPSPRTEENACYFYNRRQPEGIRFLSYHCEADAEVVDAFDDVALALTRLTDMGGPA